MTGYSAVVTGHHKTVQSHHEIGEEILSNTMLTLINLFYLSFAWTLGQPLIENDFDGDWCNGTVITPEHTSAGCT